MTLGSTKNHNTVADTGSHEKGCRVLGACTNIFDLIQVNLEVFLNHL